jgi:hypothetical protein
MNLFRLKDCNYTNQKFNGSALLLIALVLLCFALLPRAQAVVPPPDGGYPGFNTAEGQNVLFSLTTGAANTAVGWFALFSNTEGSFNTATGAGALLFNTADENTAFGVAALLFNTTGAQNAAIGTAALLHNTTGNANTAVGVNAGTNIIDADDNVVIGNAAGGNIVAGNDNIYIGHNTGVGLPDGSSTIRIGDPAAFPIHGDVSSCYIQGIYNELPGFPGPSLTVGVTQDGKLHSPVSSRRFKHDIKPMDKASEVILALKPVTFHYKSDPANTPFFGLIAEEVAEVSPDLVVPDKKGKPRSVRYEQIDAMLLNEFLKEHRKVEDLEGAVASLAATVKEQAAQIQKVSAQLEVSNPRTRVVLNNP